MSQPSRLVVCRTPPNAGAGFEEGDLGVGIELGEAMGGGEAGDAAADDGDAARAAGWGEWENQRRREWNHWLPFYDASLAIG